MSLKSAQLNLFDKIILCFPSIVIAFAVFSCSYQNDNFLNASKISWFILVSGFFCLAWAVYLGYISLKNGKIAYRLNRIDILAVIWLIYVNIEAFVYNMNFLNQKAIVFDLGILIYFIIKKSLSVNHSTDAVLTFSQWVTFVCILESVIGLLQYFGILIPFGDSFRLTGTFKNPAPFALFLSACYPISLVFVLFKNDFSQSKMIYLVNIILILIVLPLTGNRTSWIAVAVISVLAITIRFNVLKRVSVLFAANKWKTVSLAFLLLIFITVTTGMFLFKLKPVSADGRLFIWEVSLKEAFTNPIFGSGYGSFKDNYNKWQSQYFIDHPNSLSSKYWGEDSVGEFAGQVKVAYNEYIEIFVEQGIIGLILFIILIAAVVIPVISTLYKKMTTPLFAFFLGLLAILFQSLLSYPLYSVPTFALFCAYLAILSSYISPENLQSYPDRNYSFTLVSFLPIAFFLAISGFIFKFSFNRFNLYAHYQKAYSWYKSNDLNNAEGEYAKALPGMKNDPVFLLDYSICLIANNKQTEAIHYLLLAEKTDNDPRIYMLIGDIYKLWKNYSKAEEYYKKSILIIPSRIFPKYLLVMLYKDSHQCSKALSLCNTILQTNIKVKSYLSDKIISELKKVEEANCTER